MFGLSHHHTSMSLHAKKERNRSMLLGLAETGEYVGTSLGLGMLYGKFRNRKVLGIADLLVGVLGTAVANGADLFFSNPVTGKGPSWTRWVGTAGNAGLGAVMHKVGTGIGLAWSGRKVVSLPASAALPPGATELRGDIPKAPPGDALGDRDLAALSRV